MTQGDLSQRPRCGYLRRNVRLIRWHSKIDVSGPGPPDGAVGIRTTPILSWEPGSGATSHDVYLGMTNPPEFKTNQTTTSYAAESLYYGFKYYWRVDEINANGKTTGDVWTFTTETGGGR